MGTNFHNTWLYPILLNMCIIKNQFNIVLSYRAGFVETIKFSDVTSEELKLFCRMVLFYKECSLPVMLLYKKFKDSGYKCLIFWTIFEKKSEFSSLKLYDYIIIGQIDFCIICVNRITSPSSRSVTLPVPSCHHFLWQPAPAVTHMFPGIILLFQSIPLFWRFFWWLWMTFYYNIFGSYEWHFFSMIYLVVRNDKYIIINYIMYYYLKWKNPVCSRFWKRSITLGQNPQKILL